MHPLSRLTLVEQTAAHLREGLQRRRWAGKLPGVIPLATECDVSRDTMRAALRLLEAEGLIGTCGNGRSRKAIAPSKSDDPRRALRVAVLFHHQLTNQDALNQRQILQIRHDLEVSGHTCVFCTESQADLGHNLSRIIHHVSETRADAWIVVDGSVELLQWFAAQPVPALALGGRCRDVAIAGTGHDLIPVYPEAIRRLFELGHRRIVLICPGGWRKPTPSRVIQLFSTALQERGITPSDYYFPDWEETAEGFHVLLNSLFRVTPPTALILASSTLFMPTITFLAARGLQVPKHVSVICGSFDSTFMWCRPPVTHLHFDLKNTVRRVVRWVSAVARGSEDRKFVPFAPDFVAGGTTAPPPVTQE